MTFKVENIFILLIFLNLSKIANCDKNCTLRDNREGVCVSLKECKKDKDAIYFTNDFCSNNVSEICCKFPEKDPFDFNQYETFKQFDMNKCGEVKRNCGISNGYVAGLLEFPWNALIGDEWKNFICGASLIHENYVLSAAHCFFAKYPNDEAIEILKFVRLGEHRKGNERDCMKDDYGKICADPVQDIEISADDIIIHPKYAQNFKSGDIALIKLNEAAKIHQNNIKLICLPFDKKLAAIPEKMTVIGFGRTELSYISFFTNSDFLLKIIVNRVENDVCQKQIRKMRFDKDFTITDHQFCAGNSKHICNGDSGSPIFMSKELENNQITQMFQFGIVFCGCLRCGNDIPGVFTAIYPYLPWILKNIQ